MQNKVWYFKIGNKDVRIVWPESGLQQFLAGLFGVLFVIDLFTGNLLGALLMFIFCAIHIVDIK